MQPGIHKNGHSLGSFQIGTLFDTLVPKFDLKGTTVFVLPHGVDLQQERYHKCERYWFAASIATPIS